MSESLVIRTPAGSFSAYVSRPAAAVAPALVVLQEIFGVNADMRATCDEFAEQGYLALCPDLFWRTQPGLSLTDRSEAEWAQALALYKAYDVEAGLTDIAATVSAARTLRGASGKVGVVGYCLGGLLAFLAATRTDCDASVAYYGVGLDQRLGEAGRLTHPLLVHIAEQDEFVPPAAQQLIRQTLGGHPRVEIHTYPGCRHAFARHDGQHFDAAAAQRAHARTAQFFATHLR